MSRESYDTSVLGEFFWNSTDLLSVLGSDGMWQIVNAAWPQQMGWSLDDLRSGPFIDLIHPDDVAATVREFERLLSAPDATLIEFRNRQRRRDGVYRWISWSCQGRDGMVFSAGRDITNEVEGQMELADSLETKRAILDAVVDSIITIDEHFEVLDVSPGTDRIYGVSREGRRGMNSLNIVVEEDRDHVAVELRRLFRGEDGALTSYRFRALHVDGSTLSIETRGRLIRDASGQPRAVLVSRDVTEAAAAESVMKEAKEAAERANAAKSEFMSRMSHELRTPLNSVLGFAQILEMELTSPDELEMVGFIHNSGKYLLELINEVLDISRIESGHISVMIEPIALQELEKECIDLVKPQANDFGVTIFSQSDYDFQVLGDQQRLKQVMLNLLSNAIKYNRLNGSVTITCTPKPGSKVRLSVSDTGPGINPDLLDRLFTPFDRLDAETSGIEGTGLGLALSRGLIEAIGGTMGVESAVGSGSTFWIELPNVKSPKTSISKSAPTPVVNAADAAVSTVLYVDDDVANVQLVERLLTQRPNINLVTSLLGGVGIELAQRYQPDLILLDVHLSDLHGFEVLERLRGDSRTIDLPVVVLSADATTWQRRRFRNAGVYDYLTKPLDLQLLLDVIDQHLGARAASQVIANSAERISTF